MFRHVPECSVFRVLLTPSLQCRRILGGRNLVRVRDNVVAAMYPNYFFLKYPVFRKFSPRISRIPKTPNGASPVA